MAKSCKWLSKHWWSACLPAIVSGALSSLIRLEPHLSCSHLQVHANELLCKRIRLNVDVSRIAAKTNAQGRQQITHVNTFVGFDTVIMRGVWSALTQEEVVWDTFSCPPGLRDSSMQYDLLASKFVKNSRFTLPWAILVYLIYTVISRSNTGTVGFNIILNTPCPSVDSITSFAA